MPIEEVGLHPLFKSESIHEISLNVLRELLVQGRDSVRLTNRTQIESSLLNSSRHKQAPAKKSHLAPLPPPEHTPLTPSYVTGILAHQETRWKSREHFRSFLSHHQRPREQLQLRYYHYFWQVILTRQIAVCAPQHF